VAFPERFRFPQVPASFNSERLLAGLEMLKTRDVRGDLASIEVPVHFKHGEKDAVVPVDLARETANAIQNSTFSTVPGGGHALPFTLDV
jgi:pimeloyl-ACP methyl ester carboxylesterase